MRAYQQRIRKSVILLIAIFALGSASLAQSLFVLLYSYSATDIKINARAYAEGYYVWIVGTLFVPQWIYAYQESTCPNTSVSNTASVNGVFGHEYVTQSAISTVLANGLMRNGLIGYAAWHGNGPTILNVDDPGVCFIGTTGGNQCNTCNGTMAEMCEDDNNGEVPGDPSGSCCSFQEWWTCYQNGMQWNPNTCYCGTPVVIDVLGNGYDLTSAENGILFDIGATGTPRQIAWTAAGSDDAWLTLDRNGNGTIDRGMELFGDRTPQPFLAEGEVKNGFRALAVFDRLDRGGNADGVITSGDSVFSDLRLWQDVNHNGYSEPEELHTLPALGLVKIELDYRESRMRDQFGNWFRFRSKVRDGHGYQMGRWAWDVWLTTVN